MALASQCKELILMTPITAGSCDVFVSAPPVWGKLVIAAAPSSSILAPLPLHDCFMFLEMCFSLISVLHGCLSFRAQSRKAHTFLSEHLHLDSLCFRQCRAQSLKEACSHIVLNR